MIPNGLWFRTYAAPSFEKTTIKISGNEVMSINETEIYSCYNAL